MMKMAAVSGMDGADPDTSPQTNGDNQSQTSQDSVTSSDSLGQVMLRKASKINGHANG